MGMTYLIHVSVEFRGTTAWRYWVGRVNPAGCGDRCPSPMTRGSAGAVLQQALRRPGVGNPDKLPVSDTALAYHPNRLCVVRASNPNREVISRRGFNHGPEHR